MRFEFDPAKSAANRAKHGIDFLEAQALWSDPDRLEVPGRTMNEPRFHENTIRLISVRRARRSEAKKYREGVGRERAIRDEGQECRESRRG